jgi:hypothetical protein
LHWVLVLLWLFLYSPIQHWLSEDPAATPMAVKLALLLAVLSGLAFLVLRDALVVTMSLLPRKRSQFIEGSGHGA